MKYLLIVTEITDTFERGETMRDFANYRKSPYIDKADYQLKEVVEIERDHECSAILEYCERNGRRLYRDMSNIKNGKYLIMPESFRDIIPNGKMGKMVLDENFKCIEYTPPEGEMIYKNALKIKVMRMKH